jgi:prepilin-type N-terminal cleavage/methylation domain-containing protein
MVDRRGFTLVEVAVGLTIGAVVVLLAFLTFSEVETGVGRLRDAAVHEDERANAHAWLAEAFASLRPVGLDPMGFEGDPTMVSFGTRIWSMAGVRADTRLRLALVDDSLTAESGGEHLITLARELEWIRFDYVVAYGEDVPFSAVWQSRISPPLAVRLLLGRRQNHAVDTLMFWIGGRT